MFPKYIFSGFAVNFAPKRQQFLRYLFYHEALRNKIFETFLFLVLLSVPLQAQVNTGANDVLQTDRMIENPNLPNDSVASSDDITALYFNPAGLGYHALQLGYFFGHNKEDIITDHTVFLNLLGFAFSTQWRNGDQGSFARRYTLGTGILNSEMFSVGTSYSWYDSSLSHLDQYSQWDLGFMLRPWRYLSFGIVGRALNHPPYKGAVLDNRWDLGLSVRPIPKYPEKLTLSVDTTWASSGKGEDLIPRYNVEFVPYAGTYLFGGWNNYSDVFFGLKFAQDISQLSFQANAPKNRSSFFSGGILFGRERYKTGIEALGKYVEINLDSPITEEKREGFLFVSENFTFLELLRAIKMGKEDNQVRGILITGRKFNGGWGQAEELREALADFNQKKPVYAFLENAGNKEYYIASIAEKITMPPGATLDVSGLKAETYYLKDLLEKVGVKADFIAIGDYKSAPEMFTRNEPSKFEKEQAGNLLKNIAAEYKNAIFNGRRRIQADDFDKLQNTGLYTPQSAKKAGLIDQVAYMHEVTEELATSVLGKYNWKTDIRSYANTKFYEDEWSEKPSIAVVILEGEIISGKSRAGGLLSKQSIGSDTISEVLQKIRGNGNVKAVVLRINSPGGSSLASDIIWKEIRLLHDAGKVVIVSLGNVAASGGYYLAVGADTIVTNNTSITGSIGIYTGKFSLKGLYNWLGVKKYTFKTHEKATIFSETDTFTPEERALLTENLKEFYDLFLERVQRSRQIPAEKIQLQAGGKVYTGSEALKNKMADKKGGLLLAIELARNKAELDPNYMQIHMYPQEGQNLLGMGDPTQLALPATIKEAMRLLTKSDEMKDDTIFFLMPWNVDIK